MTHVELIGGPHDGAAIQWNVSGVVILVEDRGIVAKYVRETETTALWSGLTAASDAA